MVKLNMSISKKATKLVCILAAGTGSRMGEYAEVVNKSLLPVNFKSSLTRIIESFPENSQFIIATGYKKENVKNYLKIFDNKNIKIINVSNFDGLGSGPALSLYRCKKYLQKSFYFIPCDTLISENFSKFENYNWLGVGKNKSNYKDYCNFEVNQKSEICKIFDKKKPQKKNYYNFTGLGFIKNYQQFWRCFEKNAKVKNYELSLIFNKFLNEQKIKIKKVSWEDIGTIKKYKIIKKKYEKYDFSKINEIIYFEQGKVIKFHANKRDLKNKYKKYLLNSSVFPSVKMNNDFLFYDFVKGQNFYDVVTPKLFKKFIYWCDKKLWKRSNHESSFKKKCRNFYFDKTYSRLMLFMKNNNYKYDKFKFINNQNVPTINSLLKKINFHQLYEGVPSYIHGDLQFDNVLLTKNREFKLIDWRPDFSGLLNNGDLYYDLAKLLGGILISYKEIKKNKFYYKNHNGKISFKIKNSKNFILLINELKKFCISRDLDFSKIELLAALIFLNMSPMHKHPFDKILFCYSKILINRKINEN